MNRHYAIAGVLVTLLLAAGLGAAVYTGAGPAPGGDSGDSIDEFPTEEPSDDESSQTSSLEETDPFSFAVDEIEECGQTCRDVTATLHNEREEDATGVTTYVRIFAGEDNVETDDLVWEGTVDVGTLEAGGADTTTERVELSLRDARKVDRNDGWITIRTTVESDEETVTFQDTEKVT